MRERLCFVFFSFAFHFYTPRICITLYGPYCNFNKEKFEWNAVILYKEKQKIIIISSESVDARFLYFGRFFFCFSVFLLLSFSLLFWFRFVSRVCFFFVTHKAIAVFSFAHNILLCLKFSHGFYSGPCTSACLFSSFGLRNELLPNDYTHIYCCTFNSTRARNFHDFHSR